MTRRKKYLQYPATRIAIACGICIGAFIIALTTMLATDVYLECRTAGHSRAYCFLLIGG